MKRASLIIASGVILFFFHAFSCLAGEATDRVRRMLQEVISIQTDPKLEADELKSKRRAAIKEIIGRNFDFDHMAQRSLEVKWKELNTQQRAEFRDIFRDLFQDSYTRLVLDFLKREKILYNGEDQGPEQALVKTVIVRPQEQISVEYAVSSARQGLLLRDVKIDGVSILENYRKSFAKVIQRESYQALIQRMRLQQRTSEEHS